MSEKYRVFEAQHLHFLTFTVVDWVDVFTRNVYRDIVLDSLRHCQQERGLEIGAWVLMTNHLHLIARAPDLPAVIRDCKKFTARALVRAIERNPQESRRAWLLWLFKAHGQRTVQNTDIQVWQQGSHPIELNTAEKVDQRLHYLHANPVRAGFVLAPEDYAYSSAAQYAARPGTLPLLPVTLLV